MNLPTSAQVNSALRYAGTAAVSVGGFVTFIGILPPETAHAIVDTFQKLMTDLQPVVGDVYKLTWLIAPVIAVWLAKMGWNSASPKSQVAAVQGRSDAQVETTNPELAKVPGVKLVPPDRIPPNPEGKVP